MNQKPIMVYLLCLDKKRGREGGREEGEGGKAPTNHACIAHPAPRQDQ